MQSYIFFGLAGAGKGTQRDMFGRALVSSGKEVCSLETGQLLREYVETGGPVRDRLRAVMLSGGLVPSAFPVTMWVTMLVENAGSCEYLLFDGAGRKPLEARILVELLLFFPEMNVHAVFLDVDEEEAMRRLLKRGRADDTEDAIRTRFSLFRDSAEGTEMSLSFLRSHPDVIFHTVDGVGTVDEVHQRLLSTVGV